MSQDPDNTSHRGTSITSELAAALVATYRKDAGDLYREYWVLLQEQGRAAASLISLATTKEQADTAQWWALDFHPVWYELRPAMELCSSLPLEVSAATVAHLQMMPIELINRANGVVSRSGWNPAFAAQLQAVREIAQELFWCTHRMEKALSTLVLQLGLHR